MKLDKIRDDIKARINEIVELRNDNVLDALYYHCFDYICIDDENDSSSVILLSISWEGEKDYVKIPFKYFEEGGLELYKTEVIDARLREIEEEKEQAKKKKEEKERSEYERLKKKYGTY